MGIGLSFGKNTTKTSQDTSVNKTETGTQAGTTAQSQTSTGSTTGTSTTTGTGTTTGSTTQAGTSSQNTSGQQTTNQRSQLLSDSILQALEASSLRALDLGGQQVGPGADSLTFDKDSFVANGMASAEAATRAGLETSVNGLFDAAGGTDQGNSMVALLANRLRGDSTAALAGTRANLEAQGNQIQRENIATAIGQQQAQQGFAANLLQVLRGATAETTGAATTTESTQGQQAQTGQSAQQQQNTQQQASTQQTTQDLVSIINQLLNTTNNTVGTESMRGKTSKTGMGAGLSL